MATEGIVDTFGPADNTTGTVYCLASLEVGCDQKVADKGEMCDTEDPASDAGATTTVQFTQVPGALTVKSETTAGLG